MKIAKTETTDRDAFATPVLLKTDEDMPWPDGDRLFYLVGRDGLYLARENEFFRSCVKAPAGPSDLAAQKPFFEPRFPPIPAVLIERAVGFFSAAADLHGSEAAALFAYDRSRDETHLVVPHQTATMGGSSFGYAYPIGVQYDFPMELPEDWVIFGDIHSHVDYAAYASHTDRDDELHSAGLHVVVGRIREEPPEIHVEAVVDGERFVLRPSRIFTGYDERRFDYPDDWLDRIQIETVHPKPYATIHPMS